MRRVTLTRISDGAEVDVKPEAILRCVGTDLAFKVIDAGRADVTDSAWALLGLDGDKTREGTR